MSNKVPYGRGKASGMRSLGDVYTSNSGIKKSDWDRAFGRKKDKNGSKSIPHSK